MDVRYPSEERALDMLAARHKCVVHENLALAHENARLAQENAMLRLRAMAPATVKDALDASLAPPASWEGAVGGYSNMDVSIAWQSSQLQNPWGHSKSRPISSVSRTSSLATTAGTDSASPSLSTISSDEAEMEEHAPVLPSAKPQQSSTTVMMSNIPADYTRDMLVTLMNDEGFYAKYDFLYLPIDFTTKFSNGYAFINFVTPVEAQRFQDHFKGFSQWAVASDQVCDVRWGNALQGIAAHVDRYRSSPVMHEDMPDECRPAVFSGGVRAPFPPPLKRIRPPRIRQSKAAGATFAQTMHP